MNFLSVWSLSSMDACELESRLADTEKAVNMLQAAQADLMVAMETRARAADAALPVATAHLANRREEAVVDEIAVTLRCSRMAAVQRYDTARLAHSRESVISAWRSGTIDERRVSVINDCLMVGDSGEGTLTVDVLDQLAAQAVEYAESHTSPQTKVWLTRRVLAADPDAAQCRHEAASARRSVRLHPLADGMAELVALLPAIQARQAFDSLTKAAHLLEAPHEHRTLEQRRADTMVDLLCGRGTPPQVNVTLTIDAATLTKRADYPVEVAGYGPVPAGVARKLLAQTDPVYQRLITSPMGTAERIDPARYRPSSGLEQLVRTRDFTCRFPGCRRPATSARSGTDLDHTTPWPQGDTTPDNLAVLCRHHHRVKHTQGWKLRQDLDGTLTWTTPGGNEVTTTPWRYTDPPPE